MPEERELLFPNKFCKNNNSNNNNQQRNGLIGVAWCPTPQPCPSPRGMIRGSGYGLTLGFRDWVGPSQTTCTRRGSSPQMRDRSSAWKGGTDQRRYPSPTVVQARHPSSSLWGLGNLVSDEHDILDQLFILDLNKGTEEDGSGLLEYFVWLNSAICFFFFFVIGCQHSELAKLRASLKLEPHCACFPTWRHRLHWIGAACLSRQPLLFTEDPTPPPSSPSSLILLSTWPLVAFEFSICQVSLALATQPLQWQLARVL